MPTVRLVDEPTTSRRRRGGSEQVQQELSAARQLLQQAAASGQVIELSLDADERDETVKMRYRGVARDLGYAIRFQTGQQRTYTNRKGTQEYEAGVLLVFVTSSTPAPQTEPATTETVEQPRRRRKAAVA